MRIGSAGPQRILLIAAFGAVATVSAVGPGGWGASVRALSSGNGTNTETGFDRCGLPSTSEMSYLWANSPYWWYGVYIGGVTGQAVGCTFPSSSWLNTVHNQGWNFEFIWDGLQAPNSGNSNTFSTNPSSAYSQGNQQATLAYGALLSDGLSNNAANTVLVDDLEAYEHSGYPYQSAVNSFISGWDYQLSLPTAQTYGVYGSSCGSNLAALASSSPVPDFIWGASWDGNPATSALPCVPSGYWVDHQRLKQYDHLVSPYGIVVDEDCANGPTSPSGYTGGAC